jgi:PTS system cellobiose-specific IIC component
MKKLTEFLDRRLVPPLTALSENTYLSAIRAGMVSIVPLTIIGGLFMVACFFPVAWSSGTLATQEIKAPASLAAQLIQPTNAVAKFVGEQLSVDSRAALERPAASPGADVMLATHLVRDLNRVILGPSIFQEARFTNVPLREITRQLVERAAGGMDLARLNRLLLEDSFPTELARKVTGWDVLVTPYVHLLQIPVTATFGLLAVFVCFAIGYDFGKRLKQEALASASMATLVFLMIQVRLDDQSLSMDGLGSKGLFTAILVALVCVRAQKFFTDQNWVIKLPPNVPAIVYESFLSLVPMLFLMTAFWLIRFVLGVDINHLLQTAFKPLVFALNTLPGILVFAFLVTLLWSVGINGDNTLDAIVGPIFLGFLAANVQAASQGQPLPNVTALGFFTSFVNVGGTGATLGLALVMLNSPEPGYRKISRVSLPTQVFGINEPIFFGFPIVLNPIFMIPYVLNALILTTGSFLLMDWGVIQKPLVGVPWTTPPIIGHYLVTGGDWKAAVWGAGSIVIAMAVYYPFAKAAERQRCKAGAAGVAHE